MLHRWMLASAFLTLPLAASAFGQAGPQITGAQWSEDAAFLKRALQELHPGLHRYLSPARFQANHSALVARLEKGATLGEGYLAVSQFLNTIQCGHSYTNFYNQPESVRKALFEGRDKLPFTFVWIGSQMVVKESASPECQLAPGTIVLAINGVSVAEIQRKLMTIARADGANNGKRLAYLGVGGANAFEAFDVFYPLLFPLAKPKFELTVLAPGSAAKQKVEVDPIDRVQRTAKAQASAPKPGDAAFFSRKVDAETMLLDMPGWALYNSSWDWKGYLGNFFAGLKKDGVKNLILDIRRNEGGLAVGDVLLAHLVQGPLLPTPVQRRVRYQKVPADLLPNLSTWDASFKDWTLFTKKIRPGEFELKRPWDQASTPIQPIEPGFRGRVAILMSATNSSAAYQFLLDAKRSGVATLIGQTSGGNQRGINGGAFFFATLPNSKIEFDIPLIGYYTEGRQPNAGVKPDIFVRPTVEAIRQGRDLELEAALKLFSR